MTRDEILNMKAGRDMDALIAVCVCGWEVDDMTAISPTGSRNSRTAHGDDDWLPYYSTDISAAWLVVEKITDGETPNDCELHTTVRGWRCDLYLGSANAETAPEAICKAALLAVMFG
jgi:hypothetical protein